MLVKLFVKVLLQNLIKLGESIIIELLNEIVSYFYIEKPSVSILYALEGLLCLLLGFSFRHICLLVLDGCLWWEYWPIV